MREQGVPSSGGRLQRTVAACLAAILELDLDEVPVPDEAPWTVWSNWLAQRGVGLVPIAEPATFEWPGPWLALLRAADGDGQVAVVAYGPPPDIAWHPLDGPETFADVQSGFFVAPADVALWAPKPRPAGRDAGVVEALLIAPDAEAPMVRLEAARVEAGRGVEGDRYHEKRGTFSSTHGRGHDLTLVEAEVLEALGLEPEDARRTVVTRGIDLNALVGMRFRVGAVECFAQRLCEPCAHLHRLSRPGVLRALVHQGGLRADVLADGEIHVGDEVSPATPGPRGT